MTAKRTIRPPRVAEWLLAGCLNRHERPLVLGDLDEQFRETLAERGAGGATRWYWREAARLVWGLWWWEPRSAWRRRQIVTTDDVRYAIRRLRRRPVAASVSVVTLACAIGAAAATWSLVSAVLLNPLRVHEPDRLVEIGFRYRNPGRRPAFTISGYTYPTYVTLREALPMTLAAWGTIGSPTPLLIEGAGDSSRRRAVVFATHDLFDVLGLRPSLGRFIAGHEDRRGAPLVAVLAERFWRLELASDPAVIGRVIRVRDQPVQIVGVGPRGFRGLEVGSAPDLFMPLHSIDRIQPYAELYGDRPPLHWIQPVGRLPDGVALATMEDRVNSLQLDPSGETTVVLTDVQTAAISDATRGDVRQFSRLLGATAALLLVIGSLTVGMLLLLRTESRSTELALCLALGASRLHLAASVVLEGLLLAATGAVLALPVSAMLFAGIRIFELPGGIRVDRLDLGIDGRVLAGAVAAAVLSVLLMAAAASLFGFRRRIDDVLRSRAGATPRLARRRSRSILVMTQVAVTLVLVSGAGLFARSVGRALSLNPDVDTSRLVSVSLDLESYGYDTERAASLVEALHARLTQHPAIASAGFSYSSSGGGLIVDGKRLELPSRGFAGGLSVAYAAIDLHYLDSLGVRPASGRTFGSEDRLGAPPVAIVSEALAARIAEGGSPLGHRIVEANDGGAPAEIVGVVPTLRRVGSLEPLVLYRPLAQQPIRPVPANLGLSVGRRLTFRATDDSAAAIGVAAEAIRSMDPSIRLAPMITEEAYIFNQMAPQRFGMTVMGAFGTIALLLSALGTYVLVESMATQRRREMGIRAALGARGTQLRKLLLSETVRLVGMGLPLGFALSWLGAGTIRAFLFQIEPFDPLATGGAAATIALLAAVVSLKPVLSAARIDLVRVLRED